ncbi:transposase [Desulfonema ishimotonii]|uniref:Transposase n=1 Tax=Desulfonema ishimotonii TaxID=45657 RepID=A0A401FQH3_9BACT|nr:hypothetical protein [Desulfonema ishimotonii]GBC59217.1 transposase [Desulfonema ishimotonii]
MSEISDAMKRVIRNTAKKLKGAQKREFIAEVTLELLDGNARKAEREFGWGRETVRKGIRELATSIRCIDNYSARGNKRTEEKFPELGEDIRAIMGADGQLDPVFQMYFSQGKVTARALRQILINAFGYTDDQLPNDNTIANILSRLGYRIGAVWQMDKKK